jgi:hypothetical protein
VWQYIGETLKKHDELDREQIDHTRVTRAKLHIVEAQDPNRPSWWSRFLHRDNT